MAMARPNIRFSEKLLVKPNLRIKRFSLLEFTYPLADRMK
jgi:hypothetical protein